MCYAIPGKIVELNEKKVTVAYFGEQRKAVNEFEQLQKGDYVYVQGGFVVEKISKEEAKQILKEWKKKFFELKKVDENISKNFPKSNSIDLNFAKILAKARFGKQLNEKELLQLLKTNNSIELNLLYKTSNHLRQKNLQNSCCVHGIIEFSNYCENDCSYCGIRKSNSKLERYRMTVQEIVNSADFAVNKFGFKALVLQSGEDSFYTDEMLVEIVSTIREKCGVLLFVSVGSREKECYKALFDAGARGVLLRFETSNPKLYEKIHFGNKADFNKRIELIKYCQQLGFIVATGSLIGLPNQTEKDLLNDIFLAKKLNAEMFSFGPIIPAPNTPFEMLKKPSINSVLKVLSVARLVQPNAKILITTALETLDSENGRIQGLLCGGNSLMINVTPQKFKELYSIYPNRGNSKSVEKNIKETIELLYSIGRAPTDLGI